MALSRSTVRSRRPSGNREQPRLIILSRLRQVDLPEPSEVRQVNASGIRLVGEAVGEIELAENVLVIRRIHVWMRLKTEEIHRETATRVHGLFADKCPVYRT